MAVRDPRVPFRPGVWLLVPLLLAAREGRGGTAEAPKAVVTTAVENVYVRPDVTAPVDDQLVLGETVEVLEETAGFTRVRTPGLLEGWVTAHALSRGRRPDFERRAQVASPLANLYREPDVTTSRPILTAPMGSWLTVVGERTVEDLAWWRALLPDGREAFVRQEDVEVRNEERALGTPAAWIAHGLRFLGAPYTWGGATPLGFDCSGLVYRVMQRFGVTLRRNASEQCFRDPQLVPVSFADLQPGDLLFFGTETKIDHEAMWLGDGKVLHATVHGVPATQVSEYASSPRLVSRFRYARRLAGLPGAPRTALTAERLERLRERLSGLATGATYGIAFKDLSTGLTLGLNERAVFHAASTMKAAVMLEALHRVDAGTLSLADELPVVTEFRSLVDASTFRLEPSAAGDGPLMAEHGGGRASVEVLLREMITRSSNIAANVLITRLGAESVQAFLDELGAGSVKVRRCVEDEKAYEKGVNNETDAAGMAAVMEAFVRSPRLSPASREKAWEMLIGQRHNEQIPAGLHPQSGCVVGHKTGNTSQVQHDAAVVRLPDGREYVLVILATGFGGEPGRSAVFETTRRISRAVWDEYVGSGLVAPVETGLTSRGGSPRRERK